MKSIGTCLGLSSLAVLRTPNPKRIHFAICLYRIRTVRSTYKLFSSGQVAICNQHIKIIFEFRNGKGYLSVR
jgi:hypothetical protein